MSDNKSFPREAFDSLAQIEPHNWWFVSRNKVIAWTIARYTLQKGKYLEIGCGTGFVLGMLANKFPSFKLTGTELYPEGMRLAKKRIPTAEFFQLDAKLLNQKADFDVIGAFDVLEHIDEDSLVLRNIYKALKYDGTVIFSVPQHKWLWSVADEYANHVRRYTRKELNEKVLAAGFKIEFCSSFVSLLLPLMFISRVFQPKLKNYDPLKEFKIPYWVNAILEKLMSIELFLIKKGFKFPAGGSLILVATK